MHEKAVTDPRDDAAALTEQILEIIWKALEDVDQPNRRLEITSLIATALQKAREEGKAQGRLEITPEVRKLHLGGSDEGGTGVYLEWRGRRYGKGPILWAITRNGLCLNHESEWEYEPQPSSRDDAFIARCRWTDPDEARRALIQQESK